MKDQNLFLEHYYESVILPLYTSEPTVSSITWKDHGKIGPDAWAHYFEDKEGTEFVLLYEDFPGSEYLDDNLTHQIVKYQNENSIKISSSADKKVDNVIGYFTLYKEKRH